MHKLRLTRVKQQLNGALKDDAIIETLRPMHHAIEAGREVNNTADGFSGIDEPKFASGSQGIMGFDVCVGVEYRGEGGGAPPPSTAGKVEVVYTTLNPISLSHCTSSVTLALSFLLTVVEPFGIVAGFIGITPAFTDCFEYAQFDRHFNLDFETSHLALDCARHRLTRWGESVNNYDDPKLGRQDAIATEIQLAKDALL
ncbi:hypothetical protein VE01_02449 [Pseudogymnoascus verrucosus]|uniref:Prion-inhibition and propagation HeLo domain-containing protein n=1 Tax=Pseudogymnoascus verrucosus TaxID=342668 RepID=A0A1B8GSY9_9PEZI|nr:uncharacterized protein VE01_02449 [Pseudogymnoascus verrucosus]OBT98935.1 hypothetical protein VE01_02449 [Pseudogymnoascus verrucosus]